ncbi:MAG: hypothetical protein ACK4M7_08795 [Burkholderiales bacterium]
MDTRISTLSLHQNSVRDMSSVMADLARTQRQISSGKMAETFAELNSNGKVERILNLEERLQRIDDYVISNHLISNRIKATDLAVERILEASSQLRDNITLKRSGAITALPLTQISQTGLTTVMDNLNMRFEGRYIFAGSQTDNIPVSDIIYTSNIVNTEPTANYYQGDNVTLTSRASENLEIPYGVRANEEAFQKLIAAYHIAIQADKTNDDEKLTEALDLTTTALNDLIQLRSKINNNMAAIDEANESHETLKIYLNEVISNETATNIPEATIKISTNQLTLQAIYQTLARINKLTLSDYLR